MGSGSSRTKSGFVLGTGAEITVEVGFTPKRVTLVREQDTGETEYSVAVDHFSSMPAASVTTLSSSPNAGAMWTRPVPSSVVT